MSCALTQGYNLDCRNSVGGVKEVHIIEFENVTVSVTAGVTTTVTKATGKAFFKYSLIKQTGSSDETLAGNEENGTVFVTQSVKFPTNKMQPSVRNEISLLAQNRLVIVVVDQNGTGWLFGLHNGMLLKTLKTQTGVKMGDRNGYEFDFEGFEPELAVKVDSVSLAALQTAGS